MIAELFDLICCNICICRSRISSRIGDLTAKYPFFDLWKMLTIIFCLIVGIIEVFLNPTQYLPKINTPTMPNIKSHNRKKYLKPNQKKILASN